MTTENGEAALRLAELGFRVFPCDVGGKKPAIVEWQKKATTDANVIRGWWSKYNFNIGLATGADSGCMVLDWDGPEGYGTRNMLEAKLGKFPVTVTARTGKGAHEYYRYPAGLDIRNKQNQPLYPGHDIRGNGGYVLAPPSLHPSGKNYAWKRDPFDHDLQDLPEAYLDLILTPPAASNWTDPESWRSFIDQHVEGSERHAACARLYGLLIRRMVEPALAIGLVELFNAQRCTPPLPAAELRKLADELAHREAVRIRNGRTSAW